MQFFSTRNGHKMMEFVAHKKKVLSIYMADMKVLITGKTALESP